MSVQAYNRDLSLVYILPLEQEALLLQHLYDPEAGREYITSVNAEIFLKVFYKQSRIKMTLNSFKRNAKCIRCYEEEPE